MFQQFPLAFEPGIFSNRSRRASKQRWVNGQDVRFTDGVPAQVGGWLTIETTGVPITGAARGVIAWRPNNQSGRFMAIGTENGAFLYDGDTIADITPAGFVPGSGSTVIGDGFGAGRFGVGAYGEPSTDTGNVIDASNWTFDMFGETLIGCFSTDGRIYGFTANDDTVLVAIPGAPVSRAICVSDERHLFAFGADGVPGRVAWSDRENYSVWEPTDTNRAGSYDLPTLSPFQCGKRCRGQIIGWTQTDVWAFAPLSNALVYSREKLATNAGAAGPQAVAVVTDGTGEAAYWIGRDNFWVFDGEVRILDCDLHDYVFRNMNRFQSARFHARHNGSFNEVWFWYSSADSDEVDRAVIYDYKRGTWSKASAVRLCWQDAGVFPDPIAIDAAGTLYAHEVGVTADGEVIPSFVQSAPITVGVGQQLAEIDQFWPDMQGGSAPCDVSFICRDAPGGDPTTVGPFRFAVPDETVSLSIAAREVQIRIAGATGGWELGVPLLSMQGGSLR